MGNRWAQAAARPPELCGLYLALRLVPCVKVAFALVERVALAGDNFVFTTQALALLGQGGFLRRQRLVLVRLPSPEGCAVGRTGWIGRESVGFVRVLFGEVRPCVVRCDNDDQPSMSESNFCRSSNPFDSASATRREAASSDLATW